jgi:hypothetical protein
MLDMLEAAALPGEVYQNPALMVNPETGRTSDYAIGRSADLAGMMTLGSGAIPADKNSLRVGMKVYHGSPKQGLSELLPSTEGGALGPGVYASPFDNVANRYKPDSGALYNFDVETDDLFNGVGRTMAGPDENYFQTWRSQTKKLIDASPPEEREKIAKIVSKFNADDGYSLLRELAYQLGSKEKAQKVFKRAGFKGLSAMVDGPEVLMFDKVPLAPKQGIKAYHGSPHDFDRFSMDKIGTGEGAQAYGHGLYFADSEAVAKSYKQAGPEFMRQVGNINDRMSQIAKELDQYRIPGAYGKFKDQRGTELYDEYTKLMESRSQLGRMYEVNIDANPDDFLDWDRPLSEQSPKVQEAVFNNYKVKGYKGDRVPLREVMDQFAASGIDPMKAVEPYDVNRSGGFAWHGIVDTKNADGAFGEHMADPSPAIKTGPKAAMETFREAGIPGIKYLDAGSRSAGDGSRNYVVFDDKLISIVKKYGVAALVSAGVLSQSDAEALAAQGYE